MKYLKLYESFSIGRDAYVITDENGEYIYNENESILEKLGENHYNHIPIATHNSKIEYDILLENYVYWNLKIANESLSYLHKTEDVIILIDDQYDTSTTDGLKGKNVIMDYDTKKMKIVKILLGAMSDSGINLG